MTGTRLQLSPVWHPCQSALVTSAGFGDVRRSWSATFMAFFLGCLTGCGPQGHPTGSVEGKVTFRSESVGEGHVVFESRSHGSIRTARLNPDGTYQMDKVPVAEYVVTVIPLEPELPNENTGYRGAIDVPMPDPQNIPLRYRAATTSPLRSVVQEGSNLIDLELGDDRPK